MLEARNAHDGKNAVSTDKSVELQRMLYAHSKFLLRYIRSKMNEDLRSFVDASDVLQDVFFNAFRQIRDFDSHAEDSAVRWLTKIARNRVLELARMHSTAKRGGKQKSPGELDDYSDVEGLLQDLSVYTRTPSQSAMSHEQAAAVQQSMERIEPDYREVLKLRYVDGLTARESADRMGRTEGAIFMLCNRGLKCLKEHLMKAGTVHG